MIGDHPDSSNSVKLIVTSPQTPERNRVFAGEEETNSVMYSERAMYLLKKTRFDIMETVERSEFPRCSFPISISTGNTQIPSPTSAPHQFPHNLSTHIHHTDTTTPLRVLGHPKPGHILPHLNDDDNALAAEERESGGREGGTVDMGLSDGWCYKVTHYVGSTSKSLPFGAGHNSGLSCLYLPVDHRSASRAFPGSSNSIVFPVVSGMVTTPDVSLLAILSMTCRKKNYI
ncbi:hypothetical protein DEU56DRAFT_905400, partial [Suillus clintonianus]|uniref:uncharacterized protein n=1 Tax=Suillus clintonianus TaxID=1904413 RepID=UPI001B88140E